MAASLLLTIKKTNVFVSCLPEAHFLQKETQELQHATSVNGRMFFCQTTLEFKPSLFCEIDIRVFTARVRSTREGNIFTWKCLALHHCGLFDTRSELWPSLCGMPLAVSRRRTFLFLFWFWILLNWMNETTSSNCTWIMEWTVHGEIKCQLALSMEQFTIHGQLKCKIVVYMDSADSFFALSMDS